jgi:hypothetical protein
MENNDKKSKNELSRSLPLKAKRQTKHKKVSEVETDYMWLRMYAAEFDEIKMRG